MTTTQKQTSGISRVTFYTDDVEVSIGENGCIKIDCHHCGEEYYIFTDEESMRLISRLCEIKNGAE